MNIDKDALRKAAEAATKEEWRISRAFGQLNVQNDKYMLGDADTRHIVASQPATVIALLDENAALVAALKETLEQAIGWYDDSRGYKIGDEADNEQLAFVLRARAALAAVGAA